MADEIVHLKLPDRIYKTVQKQAEKEGRTLSNLLRFVICKYAERLK